MLSVFFTSTHYFINFVTDVTLLGESKQQSVAHKSILSPSSSKKYCLKWNDLRKNVTDFTSAKTSRDYQMYIDYNYSDLSLEFNCPALDYNCIHGILAQNSYTCQYCSKHYH